MLSVVQVPQLGTLPLGIPLAERVSQREDPLLGACPLFVAACTTEYGIEPVLGDRVEQRHGLQGVADAVGSLREPTVGDVLFHARHVQPQVVLLDDMVAEREHLGKVVTRVDVQQCERQRGRPERLDREVQEDCRVLAAGEEDHGTFELARDLAEDVDRFRFQGIERVELAAVQCVSFGE